MLKKALIGLSLLTASSLSSAAYVVTQQIITGADMAGITVEVNFADGNSELATWAALSANSGGVSGNSWTLVQEGDSLGNETSPGVFDGLWTMTNTSADANLAITSFTISGQPGNVAFDTVSFDNVGDDEGTPGSNQGRFFIADSVAPFTAATGEYFGLVDSQFDDLFWDLVVTPETMLMQNDQVRYFADTDLAAEVSAPATLALTLAGLALFTRRQSRK